MTKKVILTILDGWGNGKKDNFDAVEMGTTPFFDSLVKEKPISTLMTFGEEVGLPEGQMGNSEVGHLNIGAGRVVYQELPKINKSIKEGQFEKNEGILKAIKTAKDNNSSVHIMGLFSDGGVHSHINHLLFAIEVFAKAGLDIQLHLFTDGRDTPPQSASNYLKSLNEFMSKYSNIKVATVNGRYYAMDRDNRWERVSLCYDAMVCAKGERYENIQAVLDASYKDKKTDEFIVPAVVGDYQGMKDNDVIFMINYRSDRAREILNALVLPDFDGFKRSRVVKFSAQLGMVKYSEPLLAVLTTIFPPTDYKNTLGEWLSSQNKTQLRVAETEKYPHVTFFFSGGREEPYPGEDRLLIPSPKVATYDLKPEMSAYELTADLVKDINTGKHDFIVINFANGDMVGHTGVMEAASAATTAVDKCLKDLSVAIKANDYSWLIIADHGNCELMWDEKNNVPHTQHTVNLVPVILANAPYNTDSKLTSGKLADVAPTVLELMGLETPSEMDGKSLLKK